MNKKRKTFTFKTPESKGLKYRESFYKKQKEEI